ncbi:MBL fold metallo-hydrolase [Actinokineospora auranticolor]|uniref:L-ascorbate metabolism protein UlaG (Beta-lactamase superfamily) n=1 Tax=Actinokineospora auranticolor TaxID=155976 RepID=A0A2S6GFQ9_9PSEU|nr:MBL fold metallo-hydrolase [Actinokineospora auranticolor]PPK64025.1 L-ascorbate metabolism protein UlaG (beta-lactamase superfamily) [Actinokineospora auranticolor]
MKKVLAALGLAGLAWVVRDIPVAMGRRASGERAERMARSPQFRDGTFHNRASTRSVSPADLRSTIREYQCGGRRRPAGPIPLVDPAPPVSAGLHITWHGHATALVEVDGARVLVDPVWGDRVSPSRLVGPKRLHRPPHDIAALPRVDAIVISHDHYDHLDLAAVRELVRTQDAPFVVPLGIGAHLERWRVPDSRIVELDWSESVEIGGARLTATAAQHFSGRGFSRDGTLWASWVIAGAEHRVFYTGDSGYFDGYAEIGAEHGPFDATLVQIGAYAEGWPDIHMTPEEGVRAHVDVRGGLLIPVHWATFTLAPHPWADPVRRVLAAAEPHGVRVVVPRPGERVDVGDPPAPSTWWEEL